MTQNTLPKAVQDCHNLLTWLIPLLDNFPRNRRFTLGERLESGLLEILECLVEAAYVKNKRDLLKRANNRLAVIRHLWRMAYELQTIPAKRYEHGARLLEELGKQVGGWLKSVETPQ
ncbi:MAG: diversity-generating retroelement protein Avd [Methylococcaceae bacterium]